MKSLNNTKKDSISPPKLTFSMGACGRLQERLYSCLTNELSSSTVSWERDFPVPHRYLSDEDISPINTAAWQAGANNTSITLRLRAGAWKMLPGLLLAVEQLLRHWGALLCILCDQTQPPQQVVVREQHGLWLSEERAKHRQAWGETAAWVTVWHTMWGHICLAYPEFSLLMTIVCLKTWTPKKWRSKFCKQCSKGYIFKTYHQIIVFITQSRVLCDPSFFEPKCINKSNPHV